MSEKVTKEEALADIRRVTRKLGEAPSVAQYSEHGQHSVPTAAREFDGSFVKAREAAGVAEGRVAQNTREKLLADIRQVAEKVGGEPSKDEYDKYGNHGLSTITYRFESWLEAKKEAGVYNGGVGSSKQISRECLIEDLQAVDSDYDGAVTQRLYDDKGEYSHKTVQRYFDGWEDGCQKAGVTRPNMGPNNATDDEIIVDIQRVKEKIGHYPSKAEYNDKGNHTEGVVKYRFGTWMSALEDAGFEGNPQDGERNPNWKESPKYVNYTHAKWKENRPKALERDNHECQHCKVDREEHIKRYGVDLTVHHITRYHYPDDPAKHHQLSNLITLCKKHHRVWEGSELAPKENRS